MNNYDVQVFKSSRRKTLSLSVTGELTVIVNAPDFLPDSVIWEFIRKHRSWIERQLAFQRERNAKVEKLALTEDKIQKLKEKARVILASRVGYYSKIMNVKPTAVKITSAKTRWGSCSGKNSLNFSYRLILLPPEAVDAVVVHELAHIRVKNHSSDFYDEVEKYMPDYKSRMETLRSAQRELGL